MSYESLAGIWLFWFAVLLFEILFTTLLGFKTSNSNTSDSSKEPIESFFYLSWPAFWVNAGFELCSMWQSMSFWRLWTNLSIRSLFTRSMSWLSAKNPPNFELDETKPCSRCDSSNILSKSLSGWSGEPSSSIKSSISSWINPSCRHKASKNSNTVSCLIPRLLERLSKTNFRDPDWFLLDL